MIDPGWAEIRRCPGCGSPLEEWGWPLPDGTYVPCGRCGRLYVLEGGRLSPVALELLDAEFRPFAEELLGVVTRRFYEARIREVLSQPKGAPS